MKRFLILALALVIGGGISLKAQEIVEIQEGSDSLNTLSTVVDTDLLGKDILTVIGPGVTIMQPEALKDAFAKYVHSNASKPMAGYRIRVFFERGQNARNKSLQVAHALKKAYPRMGVYQSFDSPNFIVFLGDFRTRHDAMRTFNQVKAIYPTAMIMRQNINYAR